MATIAPVLHPRLTKELEERVLRFLNKPDLARLAQVNKAVSEIALNILWEEVDINRLFGAIIGGTKEMHYFHVRGLPRTNFSLTFSLLFSLPLRFQWPLSRRVISGEEWFRMEFYSRRILRLFRPIIIPCEMTEAEQHNAVQQSLANRTASTESLLPNVKNVKIAITSSTKRELNLLDALVPVGVQHVVIRSDERHGGTPLVSSVVAHLLGRELPSLVSFATQGTSAAAAVDIASALDKANPVTVASIEELALDHEVGSSILSRFPNIKSLKMTSSTYPTVRYTLPSDILPLLHVINANADIVLACLRLKCSQQLSDITVRGTGMKAGALDTLQAIIDQAASDCALTLRRFYLFLPPDTPSGERDVSLLPLGNCLNMCLFKILGPLSILTISDDLVEMFACSWHNLRTIVIKTPETTPALTPRSLISLQQCRELVVLEMPLLFNGARVTGILPWPELKKLAIDGAWVEGNSFNSAKRASYVQRLRRSCGLA